MGRKFKVEAIFEDVLDNLEGLFVSGEKLALEAMKATWIESFKKQGMKPHSVKISIEAKEGSSG